MTGNLNERKIMGQYLKNAYKERDLELAYNRMRKLLKMSKVFVENLKFYDCSADLWKEAEYLHERLTLELYGLENYKGLKGGKKCG